MQCFSILPYYVAHWVPFAGGYTLRNVARCWCFETSRMLGLDLPDELPETVGVLLLNICGPSINTLFPQLLPDL